MDIRQQRTLRSFQNVLVFVSQHPIKPEVPLLGRMLAQLREVMRRIGELNSRQNTVYVVPGGTATSVRKRRTAIRREMMVLVRIAGPLLQYAPGEGALRVPHARASAETVSKAAAALANALTPHAKLLKDAGYSRQFLREFRAQAKAVADWEAGATQARNERSIATTEIAEAFKKGMQTVMVIEGLVMRGSGKTPEIMRLWKNRRRVSKRLGRPKRRNRTGD